MAIDKARLYTIKVKTLDHGSFTVKVTVVRMPQEDGAQFFHRTSRVAKSIRSLLEAQYGPANVSR